eukprot:TRINITY_DN5797_c0_g1_i1.p1 TRINITY_DN5797_c0_g1~~TRINITY_DN5797_c0_g1_i1.p1  ORF type:complete len:264 (-),score=-18.08 TRINITY_DN5797_c0_g1_i1:191-982(-)
MTIPKKYTFTRKSNVWQPFQKCKFYTRKCQKMCRRNRNKQTNKPLTLALNPHSTFKYNFNAQCCHRIPPTNYTISYHQSQQVMISLPQHPTHNTANIHNTQDHPQPTKASKLLACSTRNKANTKTIEKINGNSQKIRPLKAQQANFLFKNNAVVNLVSFRRRTKQADTNALLKDRHKTIKLHFFYQSNYLTNNHRHAKMSRRIDEQNKKQTYYSLFLQQTINHNKSQTIVNNGRVNLSINKRVKIIIFAHNNTDRICPYSHNM